MKFRQRSTIIAIKVIGRLFDTSEHAQSRNQDFTR